MRERRIVSRNHLNHSRGGNPLSAGLRGRRILLAAAMATPPIVGNSRLPAGAWCSPQPISAQVRTILAITLAATSALLAAQGPRSAQLSELLSLVHHHAPGRDDEAVARLALWPRRDVETASNDLRRFVKAVHPASPTTWRLMALEQLGVTSPETLDAFLVRTAMLHSDVAIFRRNGDGYSLPLDHAMEHPLSVDGRPVGTTTGTFHWEAARRVLDLVQPSAAANADVLLWYQTTTAILESWNDYYELEPHLIRARGRFSRDAVLLMYDGTVHENFAEPRIQNIRRQDETGGASGQMPVPGIGRVPTGPPQKKSWFASPEIEWRTAQTLYEQSLKMDPHLVEARIRLARVLALQDQHDAAVTHLTHVLSGSVLVPKRLRYVACLLLGREQWTLGRRAEAEGAYREAAALYPGAQSPQFGLSQVAHDRGDRQGALTHLAILERPPMSDDRDDPWWTYSRVHVPDTIELMTTLMQRLSK
jgi:tetratricopeptide (TPR) repeat protein